MSLDSVHSAKSMLTTTPTSPDSCLDDSESTFDGHDSFASLGEDEDDDEAYREGRNQIARQSVEGSKSSSKSRNLLKSNDFRLKKGGIQGTQLDFIAE